MCESIKMHAGHLSDELITLIRQLNSDKISIWKQMRIVEIVSAVIAEKLIENRTQFLKDPDKVIWPDGNITKMPTHKKRGKGRAKKVPATSKNGVFGKIVQNYGHNGQSVAISNEVEVVIPAADGSENSDNAGSTSGAEGAAAPKRRGKSVKI